MPSGGEVLGSFTDHTPRLLPTGFCNRVPLSTSPTPSPDYSPLTDCAFLGPPSEGKHWPSGESRVFLKIHTTYLELEPGVVNEGVSQQGSRNL